MKKILIVSAALVLPALASAQVSLMSGYNFGQFLGSGYPALDGTTGDPVNSIGANWGGINYSPAGSTSGEFVGLNGLTGDYSNGTGRVYWDGTGGSSDYNNAGTDIVAAANSGFSVNGTTVDGVVMSSLGDNSENLGLRSNVAGNRLAFVQNTSGYLDYNHSLNASLIDDNLTFAAQAFGSPVTISWYLGGSGTAFATTVVGTDLAAYSVDLDPAFYGLTNAALVAQIGTVGNPGSVMFDNVQFNGAAIPEPSTYAAILGVVTMGIVVLRRRKKSTVAAA